MIRFLVAALSLIATSACVVNLDPPPFPQATSAEGATAVFTLETTTFVAEILEVRAGGYLVLTKERADATGRAAERLVRLLPNDAIRKVRMNVRGVELEDARLLSRFPTGLSPQLLSELLKSCGQAEVAGIRPIADEFLDRAVAGTARYRDQSAAILDGYRRIGADFPAMGEHWIRVDLVFDGVLDPARPEVLNYIAVNGSPQLAGLGYAVPLLKGELPPDLPSGRSAWHAHFKSIEEETFVSHAEHHGEDTVPGDGPRIAMLHAWIGTPNPDGVFAADNWALPYARLGLTAPADAPVDAAKALALVSGGVDFFEKQLSAEHAAMGHTMNVRPSLVAAQSRAEAIVDGHRAGALTAAEIASLADVWRQRR
jgi:hypothetical protein